MSTPLAAKTETSPQLEAIVAKKIIFSFWAGPIPEIAELHFKSVLHYMGDASYHLFLDVSKGTSTTIPECLQWLESHPRVTITRLDALSYLRSKSVDLYPKIRIPLSRRIARLWWRRWFWLAIEASKSIRRVSPRFSHYLSRLPYGVEDNAIFGITAGHGFRPWRLELDLSYRADVLRIVALELFPGSDVLWLDLDVALLRELSWINKSKAMVYRWGDYPFGNNAVIWVPNSQSAVREDLLLRAKELGSFRPWTLFSNEICAELGIKISDVNQFDPRWSRGSRLYRSDKGFITSSALSEEIADELESDYFMIHWHNNWENIPEDKSPYTRILGKLRESQMGSRQSAPNLE